MAHKGGFKNIKLGKNVYRQMKRRGQQEYMPPKPAPHRPIKNQGEMGGKKSSISMGPDEKVPVKTKK